MTRVNTVTGMRVTWMTGVTRMTRVTRMTKGD